MTTNAATKSKTSNDSKPPAKPSAGHKRLSVWIGKWNTKGQQHAGPVGPAAKIVATDTFEWAKGEFFMVHRFDGKVGDDDASCIEITGYDSQTKRYSCPHLLQHRVDASMAIPRTRRRLDVNG